MMDAPNNVGASIIKGVGRSIEISSRRHPSTSTAGNIYLCEKQQQQQQQQLSSAVAGHQFITG
jgi:hypothetical protein